MGKKSFKSFISNLNNNINKMSKIFLVLICFVYAAVLGLVLFASTASKEYLIIPSYEHVFLNEKINPQISIIPTRTYDDEGKMTLKYSVRVYVIGRSAGRSNSDPNIKINNLKVSASTVETVSSHNVNKMYKNGLLE